jgi:tetratricopeptide (TPR) repeat protein
MSQIARRDYDAAIADFTKVIEFNAYYADAYYGRGLAQAGKGNYDAAIAEYDRAVEFIPPVIEAFSARGTAKLAQGKVDEGLADFDEAVKADPKNATSYQSRGDALKAQGKLAAAEDSYRAAARLAPDNVVVLYKLGSFLVEQNKDLPEALKLIQRAVDARPTDASLLDSLGWVQFKLGNLDEAERYLSESVRRDGDAALAQEHLGDFHARRGEKRLARDAWKKALSRSVDAASQARLKEKLKALKE